ncbi:MAG: DUF393 domain-containing protein [Gemmatimonadetes bacterium]|nr:DUF393 domain-containing protein [Gemmatimonadota bacterium]
MVLLYDGLCGFCNGTVRFILERDRRRTMTFAALQGDYARGVIARHPELGGVDSLILVDRPGAADEQVRVRSDAALEIARYLGGLWSVAGVLSLVPRVLRDWGYDLFARSRYRLFGRYESCPVPELSVRERFL